VGALGLLLYVGFFDSHSIADRIAWEREAARLAEVNAALEAEIVGYELDLQEVGTDAFVERVARQDYGMRRPGDTVYPVEVAPQR
jgi:cell division protein FtsB